MGFSSELLNFLPSPEENFIYRLCVKASMEFEEFKPKEQKGVFGGKKHPARDNTNLALGLIVVLLVVIIVFSLALNLIPFKNPFGLVTGNVISNASGKLKTGTLQTTEVKTIKNLKISTDFATEAFEVPIENLDMAIVANELQLITPATDITVNLEKPIRFEAFSGRLYWRDSMFILEGKLNKYISEALQMNWKTDEDVKIRINRGSVEISQINIPLFESVVSGNIEIAEKITLTPTKDSLMLNHYRGYFKAVISENEVRVILDGAVEDMTLGSQEFSFNVE